MKSDIKTIRKRLKKRKKSNKFDNLKASFYKKAHLVCLDEPELRLALSNKISSIDYLANKLKNNVDYKILIVTLGANGIFVRNKLTKSSFEKVRLNAFELNPVDTIGAGDAVFGITSLLSCIKADTRIIAFIGNIFGSLATKILGHSDYIKRNHVAKTIQYSLK